MFQWDVLRKFADHGYDSAWPATGFVQRPLALGLLPLRRDGSGCVVGGFSRWSRDVGVGALWPATNRLPWDYQVLRSLTTGSWTHVAGAVWEW